MAFALLALVGNLASANERVVPSAEHALGPSPALPGLTTAEPGVVLIWFDPDFLLPSAPQAFVSEVGAIFRDIGVGVAWRRGGPQTPCGEGPAPEVPVILLPRDPRPGYESEHIMGLVMANQQPRRAVWVFLDAVRWTLGQAPLDRALTAGEEQEVGLALARVIAHELIHAIAPHQPHAHAGLMSRSLNRTFLLGPRIPLERPLARSFRSHLRAGPPPGEGIPLARVEAAGKEGGSASTLTPADEPP